MKKMTVEDSTKFIKHLSDEINFWTHCLENGKEHFPNEETDLMQAMRQCVKALSELYAYMNIEFLEGIEKFFNYKFKK